MVVLRNGMNMTGRFMVHGHGGHGDSGLPSHGRLLVALGMTSLVCVAELVGAAFTGSLALFVDAGHMVTDIAVLAASTVTAVLMRRRPNAVRTWGWARLEVITAACGGLVLLAVGVYALVEAALRLIHGDNALTHQSLPLLLFGVIGLLSNVVSLVVLHAERSATLNMRAAFLEVVNDALGSCAVVVSAVVLWSTGWAGFDALAGALIAALMVPRAVVLVRAAGRVLLEEAPEGLDVDEVRRHMLTVPHVVAVHDVHASAVSSGLPVLTAHIIVEDGIDVAEYGHVLMRLRTCVAEHFPVSIEHSTFQLEPQAISLQESEAVLHA